MALLGGLWLLTVATWVQAQSLTWQSVNTTTAGGTPPNQSPPYYSITQSVLDASGNIIVVGGFQGTVTFGSTTLETGNSQAVAAFIAKWNPATSAWMWAYSSGTENGSFFSRLATSGTALYVAGNFTGSTTVAGVTLTSPGNGLFLAKFIDDGTSLSNGWAVGMSGSNPPTPPNTILATCGIAVVGNAVYMAGDFSNDITLQGTTFLSAGGKDVYVAKYIDNGTSASNGWKIRAGGTDGETPQAMAVSSAGIYLAGSFSGINNYGSTTLTSSGSGSDVFLVKFADNGSSASVGWAVKEGGSQSDAITALTVNGSTIYAGGNITGTDATIGGTALTNAASTASVFVAKYLDNGTSVTPRWGISSTANGSSSAQVRGIGLEGSSVFITGIFNTGITVAGTALTGNNNSEIYVARFTDNGTTASGNGALGAGSTGSDAGASVLPSGNTLYATGNTRAGGVFGSITVPNNGPNLLGYVAKINATGETPSADLSITKTDGVSSATPGGSVTYTITASNAGPSNVTGATVADALPASLTATWTCVGAGGGTCPAASGSGNINNAVNLPSGGSVTYTVSAPISASATGTLSNTATVTAPAGVTDPTLGNNSATDSDQLIPVADLSITKTDGVSSATPGGSVTYTITASNAGPSNVTGATVADMLPASLAATWTCVGAGGGTCPASGAGNINVAVNLPSGGSVTYTVSATISPSATGTLSNTATVTAPAGVTDPTPSNNSATDSDNLMPRADLAITKTNGVTSATPGGSVTYTITASNAGPSNVTGATVADALPGILTATWTCVGAGGGTCTAAGSGNINDPVNLPSGGSVTYSVSATISPSATGTLSNTATVTAPAGVTDPTPGNNSATDTDNLVPSADLSITKTDGVSSATPGGSVTYTITASNAGPSSVTGATVADVLPASITSASWTCTGSGGGTCPAASGSGDINASVNLPRGGSVTYTVSASISASATGTLSNTATVTAPQGVTDPTPGNNSATDTDNLVPRADLAITKTDGVTSATPGGSVTYTITASNAGPSNVTGATVADALPASLTASWTCVGAGGGTCPAAGSGNINNAVNLPSGGSVTYTVSASISASATGTLSNTATVTAPAGVTDPTLGNNSATDSDQLIPVADLSITKTDGVSSATPGGSVTYTITASNAGPSNVTGATVADVLPASLTATWTCVGAGGGTCPAAGSGNINDAVNLPSGGSVTYTVSANISASAIAPGTLTNTATVTAPQGVTDPTPGNNSATDTDNLVCPAITLTTPDVTNVACIGGNTGIISLTASGGSGTVTYTLSPGNVQNSSGVFMGLAAGNYVVTATYLSTCSATNSSITVNQPATAVSVQISGNTSVILGYGSNCTALTANANGGTPGYTYSWTPGPLTGPIVQVCPTLTTTYTVTATDANGCTASQTVQDVRCGNKNQNVQICYYGVSQCVSEKIAKNYLKLGATLGACGSNVPVRIGYEPAGVTSLSLTVKAYPNPTTGPVTVEVQSPVAGIARFEVLNAGGQAVQHKAQDLIEGLNEVPFELGAQPAGNYLIRCVDMLGRQAVVRVNRQ